MRIHRLAGIAALALMLAGCGGIGSGPGSIGSGPGSLGSGPGTADPAARSAGAERQLETLTASQNLEQEISDETIWDLFGRTPNPDRSIQVNRYLWAATLDTLSFLPLQAADPFSGVIVTDWGRVGTDPTPYRVTVLISEAALDARSLKVAAFRLQGGRAVAVAAGENRQLENAILTRARQLRIAESGRRT